jgi:hypothetical protein
MRGLSIILATLFFSLVAEAAETKALPWHLDFFPLNGEYRYERDSSQQLVDRRPLNLAFGARKGASTFIFEYSSFKELTGNVTLSIDRQHQEYSFWWKENLINLEFVDFFVSGALGGYEEKATTTLAGSGSATDTSGFQPLGGVSAGIHTLMFRYVLFSFEGRLIAGKNFDPNPQVSLLARLGVEY